MEKNRLKPIVTEYWDVDRQSDSSDFETISQAFRMPGTEAKSRMTDDELAQEELRLDRAAKNARSFHMRWAIVPPRVCMAPVSVIRYFLAMLMRVAITDVLLILLFSAFVMSDAVSQRHFPGISALFRPAFVRMTSVVIVRVFRLIGPVFLFFALCFSAVLTIPFIRYTRYWNQRARRLQAGPVSPDGPVVNPAIWPSPPRME